MMRLSQCWSRLAALLLAAGCGLAQEATEATAPEKPRKVGRDAIVFRNGDVLFGFLERIDRENGVRWNRADALSELHFSQKMIAQLDLGSLAPPSAAPSPNLCTVQLNNGDQLQGNLESYDGEKLRLSTWFGGDLELPKSAVALLVPLGLPRPVIFQGPTGLEGWTMGKVNAAALVDSGEWVYQNNSFYALKSASIARDLNLPDAMSLQFDLEWRSFFHIAIALYTEYLQPVNLANKETEPKFGGFYSLQINPFSANLLPVKQTEPLRYLGQASLQTLSQRNSAHIDIRVSKEKKVIALLIDGVLIKQWTETDTFAGTGSALRFVHQGQGAVKISNLKVTEWDGQFEEAASITPNKSHDLARLKNSDRVIGQVKAIGGGKMTVEAGGKTLEIPLDRVKQVEFASPQPLVPAIREHTVRAFFASGLGSLTFDLQDWSGESLAAASEVFGAAKFKSAAFSRIVFDLSPNAKVTR